MHHYLVLFLKFYHKVNVVYFYVLFFLDIILSSNLFSRSFSHFDFYLFHPLMLLFFSLILFYFQAFLLNNFHIIDHNFQGISQSCIFSIYLICTHLNLIQQLSYQQILLYNLLPLLSIMCDELILKLSLCILLSLTL